MYALAGQLDEATALLAGIEPRSLESASRVRRSDCQELLPRLQNDPLHRTVYSIVIYLRPVSQPPQSPLVRTFLRRRQVIRFDYGSIELAKLEAQELLDLELPGLLPLLPLTKGGTKHERVLTMFGRLQQTARSDLMAVGAIFASLTT